MTILHLQTENGHQTAAILRENASIVLEELQSIRRAFQNLEVSWQGNAQLEFSTEVQSLTKQMQNQAELLMNLAERLEREVAEWEQIDRSGAARIGQSKLGHFFFSMTPEMPFSAGGGSPFNFSPQLLQLTTALSIGSLLTTVPTWFSSFLDRFFEKPTVISPIPDVPADGAIPKIDGTAPTHPTTGFGDLNKETPRVISPPNVPEPPKQYDTPYDVPVKSQGKLYGSAACAPTSVSMVLDYFHKQNSDLKTASPSELINMLDKGDGTPGSGVGLHRMTDDLGELGYKNITVKVDASLIDLSKALKDGPVIVTTGVKLIDGQTRDIQQAGSSIHAMVVKGISAENVVLNDPWSGSEKVFSRDTFSKMWTNGQSGLYVIRP